MEIQEYPLPEGYEYMLEMQGDLAQVYVRVPVTDGVGFGRVIAIREIRSVEELPGALSELSSAVHERAIRRSRSRSLARSLKVWAEANNVDLNLVQNLTD